jgi:hypothetical protein
VQRGAIKSTGRALAQEQAIKHGIDCRLYLKDLVHEALVKAHD